MCRLYNYIDLVVLPVHCFCFHRCLLQTLYSNLTRPPSLTRIEPEKETKAVASSATKAKKTLATDMCELTEYYAKYGLTDESSKRRRHDRQWSSIHNPLMPNMGICLIEMPQGSIDSLADAMGLQEFRKWLHASHQTRLAFGSPALASSIAYWMTRGDFQKANQFPVQFLWDGQSG